MNKEEKEIERPEEMVVPSNNGVSPLPLEIKEEKMEGVKKSQPERRRMMLELDDDAFRCLNQHCRKSKESRKSALSRAALNEFGQTDEQGNIKLRAGVFFKIVSSQELDAAFRDLIDLENDYEAVRVDVRRLSRLRTFDKTVRAEAAKALEKVLAQKAGLEGLIERLTKTRDFTSSLTSEDYEEIKSIKTWAVYWKKEITKKLAAAEAANDKKRIDTYTKVMKHYIYVKKIMDLIV
jgi:hypothetical protein